MLTDNDDPYAGISPLLVLPLLLLLTGGATGNPQCIRMRMCSAVGDDNDNDDVDDEIDVFLSFYVVLLCTERRRIGIRIYISLSIA